MFESAVARDWLDRRRTVLETLTSIRRAGADLVLTYWATEAAGWVHWSPVWPPASWAADPRRGMPWQGAGVGFATWMWPSPLRVVAEVLVAIVLGGLTWWCWHRGVVLTATRRGIALYRIEGRWWAMAVGA